MKCVCRGARVSDRVLVDLCWTSAYLGQYVPDEPDGLGLTRCDVSLARVPVHSLD